MKRLFCFLFGHKYTKMVYANDKYDVYQCPRCGRQIFLVRSRRNMYHNW